MFLPATRKEMTSLGWGALDIIIVSGDSYMDNPFMGTAVIGKTLADAGYRVGIITQSRTIAWDPVADWRLAPDLAGDYQHPLAGAGISHLIAARPGRGSAAQSGEERHRRITPRLSRYNYAITRSS